MHYKIHTLEIGDDLMKKLSFMAVLLSLLVFSMSLLTVEATTNSINVAPQSVATLSDNEKQYFIEEQLDTAPESTNKWAINGQTKIMSNLDGSHDIYINNLLSAVIIGAVFGAIAALITSIPVVASFINLNDITTNGFTAKNIVKAVIIAGLAAALLVLTSTDKGLIFHIMGSSFINL